MKTDLLFVYGTLMSIFDNPMSTRLRSEAELIGRGWTGGRLYLIEYYPGMLPGSMLEGKVFGEVYRLKDPEPTLEWLDRYEESAPGFQPPWEYERRVLKTAVEGGPSRSRKSAWAYCYNWSLAGRRHIPGGNFADYAGAVV